MTTPARITHYGVQPGEPEKKNCTRCGELLPIDSFYWVSRKRDTRRGQCKPCMAEIKALQKDPNWKPTCPSCGKQRDRSGPGRRLCTKCFNKKYDAEVTKNGKAHRLLLNPCPSCGERRLREDHVPGTALCPVCRSVPQHRRTRLRLLYNMTPRDFLALLEDQGYVCWICDRKFTKARPPHVEHQHKRPMIVRGLVCGTCNTILALAKDDPWRLRGAARFLEAPPAQYVFPGLTANPEANRRNDSYRPLRRSER